MNVGILLINDPQFRLQIGKISRILFERGYDVKQIIDITSDCDIDFAYNNLKLNCNSIIVCGDIKIFKEKLSSQIEIQEGIDAFEFENVIISFMSKYDETFIRENIIPLLNSRCKTFYTTAIFKTFDKTEKELRELLKDYIKNRNKIAFYFNSSLLECEILIRYSSKTSKPVVDDLLRNVHEKVKDSLYAIKDISLQQQVSEVLRIRGLKLKIAESFTGGGISSALVQFPGASEFLLESIVCYNNTSKIERLNVEEKLIETYGAVSIEVVYEMAANLLMTKNCDLVVATSGNAGPTSEKPNENGLCFIAVGDMRGIHIYKYEFKGSRQEVIESGIKTALFKLYKKLHENEFQQLIKSHQEN